MHNRFRTVLAIGAALALSLTGAACGGDDDGDGGTSEIPAAAVATVDGQPITKAEYEHLVELSARSAAQGGEPVIPDPPAYERCAEALARQAQASGARGRPTQAQLVDQCRRTETALREQAMGRLIQTAWLEGEAEELGIEPSDAEIERELARARGQYRPAEWQRLLTQNGMTEDDVRVQLRLNAIDVRLRETVARRAGEVSDADVAAYYARNRAQFEVPERRDVLLVVTRGRDQAAAARRAVEGGEPWAAVARRLSTETTSKANGGRLDGVAEGQLGGAVDRAVFAARRGALLGPVREGGRWYVVRVADVTPARQSALDDVREQIRATLSQESGTRAQEQYGRELQERWQAKTHCRDEYMVGLCANAPKTRTAGGTVATTP